MFTNHIQVQQSQQESINSQGKVATDFMLTKPGKKGPNILCIQHNKRLLVSVMHLNGVTELAAQAQVSPPIHESLSVCYLAALHSS